MARRLLPAAILLAACTGGPAHPGNDDLLGGADLGASDGCAPPPVADCPGETCAPVVIPGDPPQMGTAFRGYADPSIRKDPDSARIWLGYSWAHVETDADAPGGPFTAALVAGHLARSDDGGKTFAFDLVIFPSLGPMADPGGTGTRGYLSSETVDLAPVLLNGRRTWFSVRLLYLAKSANGYNPVVSTFQFRVARADSPELFRGARDQVLAATDFLPQPWGAAYSLNALAGTKCTYWNDPGLFAKDGKLYLTAECVGDATIHLFVADAKLDVAQLQWKSLGPLTTAADAAELGDNELNQANIAQAKDGALVALVTPSHTNPGTVSSHAGCRAVEIESLDPPRLKRSCGKLVVRASVVASDTTSTGSCAYEAASETGVLLAKRGDKQTDGTIRASRLLP